MKRFLLPIAGLLAVAAVLVTVRHPRRPAVPVANPSDLVVTLSLNDVGIPFPTGARQLGRVTRMEGEHGSSTQALAEVSASVADVVAFYHQHLPGGRRIDQPSGRGRSATFDRSTAKAHDTVQVFATSRATRIFALRSELRPTH